jgi:GT2 family glycosyltransferase
VDVHRVHAYLRVFRSPHFADRRVAFPTRRLLVADDEGVVPVVILNWNGEGDTLECLESIRCSAYAGFVPVVIDNGSEPEAIERLSRGCASLFTRVLSLDGEQLSSPSDDLRRALVRHMVAGAVVLVQNGENLGFARACNVGIGLAELAGAEYVLLLNNDTVVAPDAFEEIRAFIQSQPEFAAATAQIRHYARPDTIQQCGGDLTYFGSRHYRLADEDASSIGDCAFSMVTFATGCALLLRHGITGPLSEKFFFGEEDYELALRLRRRGLRMACMHRAVVLHKGGATVRRTSSATGAILVHYVSRLIDLRSYYSRLRWQLTRAFAYLYLPVVLARHGLNPLGAPRVIARVHAYVNEKTEVGRSDYHDLIGGAPVRSVTPS